MPFVTLLLVALNVLAYRLELTAGGEAFCRVYGLIPAHFTPAALLSSLFLHDPGALTHIAGNMVFLLVFGAVVEDAIGGLGLAALYLAAGAAGGLLHVVVDPSSTIPLVGASGAVFGVIAVAAVVRLRLLGFAVAFVGLNVWNAFTGDDGDVSFGCHIGGFCLGFLVVLILRAIDSEALEAM